MLEISINNENLFQSLSTSIMVLSGRLKLREISPLVHSEQTLSCFICEIKLPSFLKSLCLFLLLSDNVLAKCYNIEMSIFIYKINCDALNGPKQHKIICMQNAHCLIRLINLSEHLIN